MQTFPPGKHIGQYEIASNPMKGGMGVVYFCLDHANDGRPVALKTCKPEYLPHFLRECNKWVQLGAHPHIVRCYAAHYIDPIAFLILEPIAKEQNMENASLRPWLGAPMRVEQALLFAIQIARGMEYAVVKIPGLVHRDLKPENILVGVDKLPGTNINRLRVTDFGLSTISHSSHAQQNGIVNINQPTDNRHTQLTNGISGTPPYMAPEQWKGEPVGVYTDIYAFGCMLYEMLTGHFAAQGHTIRELRAAHCSGKLNPLPSFVPADITLLIKRCLALSSSERLNDWITLKIALENIYMIHSGYPAPRAITPNVLSQTDQVGMGWSYNMLGQAYCDIGKVKTSIDYFERALNVGRVQAVRDLQASALNNLGTAYLDLGDAWKAIRFYEQSLLIKRETGDQPGEGNSLGNLGTAHMALGELRRAIGYFEQSLAIHQRLGELIGQTTGLNNLGEAHRLLGNTQASIKFIKQALNIDQRIGNRRGEAYDLGNLGNAYGSLGDVRQAIKCYEQSMKLFCEIGDRYGEGASLGNLGFASLSLGYTQQAITYYDQALAIWREIGNRQGEGNDLGNLGLAHAVRGDVQQAVMCYEQALEINRKIGSRRAEGTDFGNLGNAYLALGDSPRALQYQERYLSIAREIGDQHGEAEALNNMGKAHYHLGNTQQAIEFHNHALNIHRQVGDQSGIGESLGGLGVVYAGTSDGKQAIKYLEQALTIRREIGDINGIALDLINMASLYNKHGAATRALPLAQEAEKLFVRVGHPEYIRRAQQLVINLQAYK